MGVINISDGTQEEIIALSTSSRSRGEGYAILRNSMVIINPAYDFGRVPSYKSKGSEVKYYMPRACFTPILDE